MLTEASEFAEEIEGGHFPPCFKSRAEAADYLARLVVGSDYQTATEREQAQALVRRLSRLSAAVPPSVRR